MHNNTIVYKNPYRNLSLTIKNDRFFSVTKKSLKQQSGGGIYLGFGLFKYKR